MRKNRALPRSAPLAPMIRESAEIASRREMLLSGVLGIEAYCACEVTIRTGCGILRICGNALTLCWAGERRLMLRGDLAAVFFESLCPAPEKKKGGTPHHGKTS